MKSAAEILGAAQPDLEKYLNTTIETYERFNLPAEFMLVLHLERDGGGCPRCGEPWEKVEFKALWAVAATAAVYYTPDCDCFPRCPECGTSWHREIAAGNERIETCPSCNWKRDPIYVRVCRFCHQSFRTRDPSHSVCGLCLGKQSRPADRTGADRLFAGA